MSLAAAALGPLGQQGAPVTFNPQTDITWHSLFWAEGTDFAALGLSDASTFPTWPNETGEADAAYDGVDATHQPTYYAAISAFGNQPGVTFDGVNDVLQTAAFTSNPSTSYSLVLVGVRTATGSPGYFTDGRTSTARNILASNSTHWGLYAGSAWIETTATYDTSPHLFVATSIDGSTGSEKLYVDGTLGVTGNAGSHVLTGITLGARYSLTANRLTGSIALVGIYEGDFTTDAKYAAFKTWVASHYGITVA